MKQKIIVNVLFSTVIFYAAVVSEGVFHRNNKRPSVFPKISAIGRKDGNLKTNEGFSTRRTSGKLQTATSVIRPESFTKGPSSDVGRAKGKRNVLYYHTIDATFAIVVSHVLVAACHIANANVVTMNAMKVAGVRYPVQRKRRRRNQRSHAAVLAVVHVVLLRVAISVVIMFIITIIIAVLAATAATVATAVTVAHAVVTAATVSDLKDPCHLHSSEDRSTFTWSLRTLISVDHTVAMITHRYKMDH
ncbi:hypothetical protein ACROYT_G006673 [Oculina patagonica]